MVVSHLAPSGLSNEDKRSTNTVRHRFIRGSFMFMQSHQVMPLFRAVVFEVTSCLFFVKEGVLGLFLAAKPWSDEPDVHSSLTHMLVIFAKTCVAFFHTICES